MDVNNTMDQYEKQLFSLFTSYDSNHNGNLSKDALQELCNTLQLEDRGIQLIKLLCRDDEECNISFQVFRDGLLTVLGDENFDETKQCVEQNENHSEGDSSGREVSPKYVFGSKKYGRRSKPSYKGDSLDVDAIAKEKKTSKVRRSISLNEGNRFNSYDCNSIESSRCSSTNLSVIRGENINFTTQPYTILDCNSNSKKASHSELSYDGSAGSQIQPLIGNSIEAIANKDLEDIDGLTSVEDFVPSENIVELWESVGVVQPQQLLHDLGFQIGNVKLCQLISVLEDEIKMMLNNVQEPVTSHSLIMLFQGVLSLYRCETKSLKLSLNHTAAERNKLKSDLSDANQRAILLAQEVDENHVSMENIMKQNIKQLEIKHADTVKHMMEDFANEKELSSFTISKLENRLLLLEAEEAKLRSQLSTLQDENFKLEKEFNKSQEQLFELTDIKNYLTKELKTLGNERQRNQSDLVDENNLLVLENQLSKFQSENIALKDKNDELCSELDNLKITMSSCQCNKEESDSLQLNSFGTQMNPMNSLTSSNDTSSSFISQVEIKEEEKDETDDTNANQLPADALNNTSSTKISIIHSEKPKSVSEEQKPCSTYGNTLNIIVNYDDNIIHRVENLIQFVKNTIKDESKYLIFNKLKPFVLVLCVIIKEIILHLNCMSRDDKENINVSNISVTIQNIVKEIIDSHDDISKPEESFNIHCKYICTENGNEILGWQECDVENYKKEINDLKECLKKERLERNEEKHRETERYQELEANLELLQKEYYKCEEYWSAKLNEERQIFDQEQKVTDDKFTELLSKLSEYEEQFTTQDRFDGPLSTIEEKCHLEKQFNDLEDEFEEYKTKAENESQAKDLEIDKLKEKVASLEESIKNAALHNTSESSPECNRRQIGMPRNENMHPMTTERSKELSTNVGDGFMNSPINYLWNQKAIPSPITNVKSSESQRDYQNPAYIKGTHSENANESCTITPIQKPVQSKFNVNQGPKISLTPDPVIKNGFEVRPEAKMLNCSDLEEALQGRRKQVNSEENSINKLDMDVQKANSLTQNNSAILRTVALEIHCRQLQAALRQQQTYAESVFQQTVAAHRAEMGALKQRLAAADLLVRDLYVENCHLARTINNPLLK